MKRSALAMAMAMAASAAWANEASTQQVEELRAELAELRAQMSSIADTVEQQSAASASNGVHIGGYGEMHLNLINGDDNQIDYHRFVLFFGKEFNDKTRFFSELELEHSLAGDGKPGEVELEQAYIEHDFVANHSVKMGMFLLPIGLLNETHEPETFYGVERNNVEKNIIPTTWWEGGVAVTGRLAPGVSYDIAAHSGLNTGDGSIRKGRQKVAEATANKAAYTARIKYTAVAGLELAASIQRQDDLLQGSGEEEVNGTLLTAHMAYLKDGIGLRALYAQWTLGDFIEDHSVEGESLAKGEGATTQKGFYIEPSYRLGDLGVFYRISRWDNQADADLGTDYQQQDAGFNYWLAPTVALKADYFRQTKDGDLNATGYNLGVGYSF
jgi:hypothetical protein